MFVGNGGRLNSLPIGRPSVSNGTALPVVKRKKLPKMTGSGWLRTGNGQLMRGRRVGGGVGPFGR